MCGIFGWFSTQSQHTDKISLPGAAKALSLMKHRGPDAQRLAAFPRHAVPYVDTLQAIQSKPDASDLQGILGHARLNIIDLSDRASQPMVMKTHWIVFNGEIYNYRQLRKELQAKGYVFQSESDTEVLLALYDAEGTAMLKRLNGMFAFAIYDLQKQEIFLARDRYGIKPLYYWQAGGEFAFASELKSLLALPGVGKKLNHQALFEHLTFQYSLGNKTLVQGIQSLDAGCYAVLNLSQGQFKQQTYWTLQYADTPLDITRLPDQIQQVRAAFETSVSAQLVGDVPIGSFLSGGMDTGAISAVATRMIPDMYTFTCGFDVSDVSESERLFDERDQARELSDLLGTTHQEMLIGSKSLPEVFKQVVWHLDDFRAGISYQNFLVSEMVKKNVTVVLSGVGGDELFAGYSWRYVPILDVEDPAQFNRLYYQAWVRLLSDEKKRYLFSDEFLREVGDYSTKDAFNQVLDTCVSEEPLHRALAYDFKTFLQALLTVEDRLSMAHSVESRVPFLDNAVVDVCLSLPAETKLQRAPVSGEPLAKWILKEALKGLLPDSVLTRRKQGFTPPDASWYRSVHKHWIESMLLSPKALERNLFKPNVLKGLLDDHFSGQANHRFLIWSLLCLEQWQQLFFDEEH